MKSARSLVAGIGNVFLADDGFGIEVVKRLAERPQNADVVIVDFGIRGHDLAYALLEDYAHVLLVDAMARGGTPGTLYVVEPDLPHANCENGEGASLEGHAIVPAQVLAMVRAMGGKFRSLRIVGCEPERVPAGDEIEVGLSDAVAAAVNPAVALIEDLLAKGAPLMHELAITQEIVAIAAKHAGDANVKRVVVEIGKLNAILPDAVRFCFGICAEGTRVFGAELEIIEIAGRARCQSCRTEQTLEQPFGVCACGSTAFDWLAGEELRVRNVEVD